MSAHISIFTPTHNVRYLEYTYDSILRQNYADWEWVLVPNGPAIGSIPAKIVRDKRVVIFPYVTPAGRPCGIGEYKRFACEQASGAIFLELDHDDMLVPGVLQDVVRCAKEGAGFIFSDDALVEDAGDGDLTANSYSGDYGWETYDFSVYGQKLRATRNFPVTARSLCEIYFAPDHVRCWTREAYYKAGGHDRKLLVGDDHRLICETYVAGAKFMHTGTVGYIYRRHKHNTVKDNYTNIFQVQQETKSRYIHKLIDRWVKTHDHQFIDISSKPLCRPLKLDAEDSSVGCVRAYSELLSTLNMRQLAAAYNEIYRVLVPGGWLCLRAPSTEGIAAFAPHHRTHFNRLSPRYLSQQKYAERMGRKKDGWRFQEVLTRTLPINKTAPKELYVYSDLCALKGQRQPGLVHI